MAATDGVIDVRHELRYRITGEGITTELIVLTGDQELTLSGEMINLSRGGATVSISAPLPVDAGMTLTLQAFEVDVDHAVTATVLWSLPAGKNRWRWGLAFDVEISEETLTKLALAAKLERRQGARSDAIAHEVDIPATAKWELTTGTVAVHVINASPGGLRLFSPQPGTLDSRLLLQFDRAGEEPVLVRAKTRWQRPVEDGHLIGCEFVDAESYRLFLRAAARLPTSQSLPTKRRSLFRWLARR